MNKKTTAADVARIFPRATIHEDDGVFSLPLHAHEPALSLIMPNELPVGPNDTTMLPGDFKVTNLAEVCRDLRTEFPIWIATGRYEEGGEAHGPKFHFEDPLTAKHLLIVARWEIMPPPQVVGELKSSFATKYKAVALMRITPPEKIGLNQVLPDVSEGMAPAIGAMSGLDFWVVEDTSFYRLECEALHADLQRMIIMGDNADHADATRAVSKQMLEALAVEIANDPVLEGWSLECESANARLTMVDKNGTAREETVLYMPSYYSGIRRHMQERRDGTLQF